MILRRENHILLLIVYILLSSIAGCSKEGRQNVIPGYIPPGDFVAKGIYDQKQFNVATYSCGPSANCLAVYIVYYNEALKVPLNGAAIRNNNITMKMYPNITGGWSITLLENSTGRLYTGQAAAGQVTFTPGTDDTTKLNFMTITFNDNIILAAGSNTITINNGDKIVAVVP